MEKPDHDHEAKMKQKQLALEEVIEKVCAPDVESSSSDLSGERGLEYLVTEMRSILGCREGSVDASGLKKVEDSFNSCDERLSGACKRKEFELVEDFILSEQNLGRQRRESARKLARSEEVRLAMEIAELKLFREKVDAGNSHLVLQHKISDAERAYMGRKMVFAKAAQEASADCRLQFARVRQFFKDLHKTRLDVVYQQFQRSLKVQEITQKLRKTDDRVVALEKQIATRLFQKKKTDLHELHMKENMEEAVYLESMLNLLDNVQEAKETAARERFELQVEHLKEQRQLNQKRDDELNALRAIAKLEMAKVMAFYVGEEAENAESDEQSRENVEATERRKDFNGPHNTTITSVSELYDTVLWEVATSQLTLSSSGSRFYSEDDYESDEVDDDEDDDKGVQANTSERNNDIDLDPYDSAERIIEGAEGVDEELGLEDSVKGIRVGGGEMAEVFEESSVSKRSDRQLGYETGSIRSGSTHSMTTDDGQQDQISVRGKIHVNQLIKDHRVKERALKKKHKAEIKQERRRHRAAVFALRTKHKGIVDGLLRQCMVKRYTLREAITKRMEALAQRQQESTEELRRVIEQDMKIMEEALRAEQKRLEDTEKSSFVKAQALISAQVFHEVRNALSSVISMSEITSTLRKDSSLSPAGMVATVDDMMDQIKEVNDYALNMLNNILDVNKIHAGSFTTVDKLFDLQDLVCRATRMQLAKAGHVKMAFVPSSETCIAYSDDNIVVRIVANLISNALKFTSVGAVQPFVWPLELMAVDNDLSNGCSDENDIKQRDEDTKAQEFQACGAKMRMMAVGVADTGPGLSRHKLELAVDDLSDPSTMTRISGARNSGFGLHFAHQLAKTVGSKVNLSSLEMCRHLLNEDMCDAMKQVQRDLNERNTCVATDNDYGIDYCNHGSCGGCAGSECATVTTNSKTTSAKKPVRSALPGRGTVIYITLPVFKDGVAARKALVQATAERESPVRTRQTGSQFVFCPRPALESSHSFRVLVADDVVMLRKGMVHTLINVFSKFPNCPVSICTACTAEDVLRALASQPFDLVICDNHFTKVHGAKASKPQSRASPCRPHVFFAEGRTPSIPRRNMISDFFANEQFYTQEGDGELLGLDALLQILQAKDPPYPTPALVLMTGDKIDEPHDNRIIVKQKPLKASDFVPLLETHAAHLIESGVCIEEETKTNAKEQTRESIVKNKHGTQMFSCTGVSELG